ncbi:MAG: hypothetical protein IH851_11275 [Armatimonadetes bacterium]|nr:hypothetical protein [Armatimonadota bacterium]
MKRLISTLPLAILVSSALAQAPFTIVRPIDGALVREVVEIQMPKGSVPRGAFIGVSVDGKFLVATVPVESEDKETIVYRLDTKARNVEDGDHTIAVTLYVNIDGKPQIADRSEVNVHVGNHEGIEVPEDGLLINYKFVAGTESVYQVEHGVLVSTLTEVQNRIGGRAAELPVALERVRLLHAIDDVKPGGIGLVRVQFLPYKGKDYLVIQASGDTEPRKYMVDELAPIWRLLEPTGKEMYADAPAWWGFADVGAGGQRTAEGLFVPLPFPQLPAEKLAVGDTWPATILFGRGPVERIRDTGTSVDRQIARGTFESVEWEQGKPCAKLKYVLVVGTRTEETETLTLMGREFRNNFRQSFEQTVWISLDDGRLVRSDLILEADFRVEQSQQQGGAPGGRGSGRGAPQITGGGGAAGGVGNIGQYGGQRRGRPAPSLGGQAPAGGGGGQGAGSGVFVRQKEYVRMVLEQE